MTSPSIRTARPVVPMIYAYTTPGVAYHDGWSKIGYTERDVKTRIEEQTHTAGIRWALEWMGNAMFDDGSGVVFRDTDFHAYLRRRGVEQEAGADNEWFRITKPESKEAFDEFRASRGALFAETATIPYALRDEQARAVEAARTFFKGGGGEFLWNCKPRFGKTLAVYDLAKRLGANTVLIVTNRPAIANSWLQDYARFLGEESGYRFVSETDALAGKSGVLSRRQFLALPPEMAKKVIEFVSLQDMKGSLYFGGRLDKLREVAELSWDLLVVDEAHEGVDTYRTDVAFDRVRRKATLHLSGTPFKALSSGKFAANAIFNWTYADEQRAKREWSGERENPYSDLPRMSLYTYRMSEVVRDTLARGIDLDGETEDWAFDLNEFFATDATGRFRHDAEVDKFLDALTRQTRFPFSTQALRDELRHTFWLLNRVDSAKALVRKLGEHPVFKDYEVILAAGDGRLDEEDEWASSRRSYDKVAKAIAENERTITVSVGQLTTGVTVPEWTGVLMLCSMKSPSLYMQAAFRAQNPCLFREGASCRRKTDAYVFDFDPARTLVIYEQFANDLCAETAAGRGDGQARRRHVGELLNFLPVIGEDERGELVELDAERVLSIPRRIRCQEVVRRGFMSNFLFQNVAAVFAAPREVMEILGRCPAAKGGATAAAVSAAADGLSLDENGEVAVAPDWVNGKATQLFGDKIYGADDIMAAATDAGFLVFGENEDSDSGARYDAKPLEDAVRNEVVTPIVAKVAEAYGNRLRPADAKRLERELSAEAGRAVAKAVEDENIRARVLERERIDALRARAETGRSAADIENEFAAKRQAMQDEARERIAAAVDAVIESGERETVRRAETRVQELARDDAMEKVRENLRGFARTIPAFLMAYGDERTTLANFDAIIPENVFLEVTGITTDEFRLLRDGGVLRDAETGAERPFEGRLFDPVVFDDSVKEFLAKKAALANWFNETAVEDIFDYIPAQRTNQIFTPRAVVRRMVDALERENPGCFDETEATFADLYVKSGMFLAEIAKRLYRSPAHKRLLPGRRERLAHIFGRQLYGLAPTEIIHRIARNYLLGFDSDAHSIPDNIRLFDALPAAKAGTLAQALEKLFPALAHGADQPT